MFADELDKIAACYPIRLNPRRSNNSDEYNDSQSIQIDKDPGYDSDNGYGEALKKLRSRIGQLTAERTRIVRARDEALRVNSELRETSADLRKLANAYLREIDELRNYVALKDAARTERITEPRRVYSIVETLSSKVVGPIEWDRVLRAFGMPNCAEVVRFSKDPQLPMDVREFVKETIERNEPSIKELLYLSVLYEFYCRKPITSVTTGSFTTVIPYL